MNKLLFLILILSVACSSSKDVFAGKDDKVVIFNDRETIKSKTRANYKPFTPTPEDIQQVDAIFQKAIDDGEFYFLEPPTLKKLKERYRQYLCYLNDNGEKMVYINSFCREIPEWKTEMYDIADGGSCYWNMEMNLTTGTYRYVMVNGIA